MPTSVQVATNQSQESRIQPDLSCGWKGPKRLSDPLLAPGVHMGGRLETELEPRHSNSAASRPGFQQNEPHGRTAVAGTKTPWFTPARSTRRGCRECTPLALAIPFSMTLGSSNSSDSQILASGWRRSPHLLNWNTFYFVVTHKIHSLRLIQYG